MAGSSCVVSMSSTDAFVLLLFYVHRLVHNEMLFGANHCNSNEDKRRSLVKYPWMKSITFHIFLRKKNEKLKIVDRYDKEELGTK